MTRRPVALSHAECGPHGGPAVILLHGLGGSRATWADVIPELAGQHRVFAVDLRGHGKSPRRAGEYRLGDYVGDVVAFLRAHIAAPAIVIGHSLGGVVALAVAQAVPALVRALVLADPPLFGSTRPADQPRPVIDGYVRIREALRAQRSRDPDAFDDVDPEVYTPVIEDRGVLGSRLDEEAACPVLVLRADGGQRPAFTSADAVQFERVNPGGARVIEMTGAGHFIHLDRPGAFLSTITCFLSGIS